MTNKHMRKSALRRYLVFRVKVAEFFDLNSIRMSLAAQEVTVPKPSFRTSSDYTDSLRTPLISWLALLIDKNEGGLNVIKLWRELFPNLTAEIDQLWSDIEPAWQHIRLFRDKAGFHADNPKAFFQARSTVLDHKEEINIAIERFTRVLGLVLHSEAEQLPDLEEAVDAFLLELDEGKERKYDRDSFKRYLMIANNKANS